MGMEEGLLNVKRLNYNRRCDTKKYFIYFVKTCKNINAIQCKTEKL